MVKQSAQTFSSALFDFTFRSFVTPKIIQVTYMVAIVFAAIDSCIVFYLCTSFRSLLSAGYGGYGGGGEGGSVLLGLIVSPIFFIIQLIAARVILEAAIALIRIAENTDPLRRREASER